MPKTSLIKIIPKPSPKIPAWFGYIFWASLVLLLFSLIVFFFFVTKISSLGERKESLRQQATQVEEGIKASGEGELAALSEKLKYFSQLLKEHKLTSRIFEFLKGVCHPKVQFLTLNLETQTNIVSLTGATENFRTLGEQLLVLRQNKDIKDLKVSNVSLAQEGRVTFRLNFNLAETALKNATSGEAF